MTMRSDSVSRRAYRSPAASAVPADDVGDLALGLVPDLGAGGAVVDLGVGQVGELVRPPGPGDLAGEPVGDAVVALRGVRWDARGGDHDLGPVGLEEGDLLG